MVGTCVMRGKGDGKGFGLFSWKHGFDISHVGKTSRGGVRGNKKFNFEFKIKMAIRYSQEVE